MTKTLFDHGRLSATNRCRIALALLPIAAPINVIWWLCAATLKAVRTFGSELRDQAVYTTREWYRHIYRPARYGSVWDDLDENGRPKAWGPVRGGGST